MTEFAPEKFVDHYQTAVRELIDAAGGRAARGGRQRAQPTGKLMDALKALEQKSLRPPRPKAPARSSRA